MKSNLRRPPTPDPEDPPQFTLAESLRIQLHTSGEVCNTCHQPLQADLVHVHVHACVNPSWLSR
jgi:hypothetical protein